MNFKKLLSLKVAKGALEILDLNLQEIDLTNKLEERLEISTKYNWRTVPIIIINEKENFTHGEEYLPD